MTMKTAQPENIKTTVQEILPAFEATWADNAEGLPQADVVIIRPGESANRRMYSKEAIADAIGRGFWDNTPMFLNHGDKSMPRRRSLEHLKARIEPGTTYVGQEGEARGKATFIDPNFAQFMRNAGSSAGLSAVHEFMGQRYRGNDGHYHERVDKFLVNHSVDFVAYPAAGGGIAAFLPAQESESEDEVDWSNLTPEMLKEHRPDLVAALAAESDDGDDKTDEGTSKAPVPQPRPGPGDPEPPKGMIAMEQVRSYVDERIEQVHTAYAERDQKRAAAKAQVSALVAKSGLPEKAKGKVLSAFEDVEEFDSKAVQEAIEDMAETLKETGWRGPVVRGLGDSAAQESDDKGDDPDTLRRDFPTMMAVEEQLEYKPVVKAN